MSSRTDYSRAEATSRGVTGLNVEGSSARVGETVSTAMQAPEEFLPQVSIVVPTHNRPEMLARLLESLRQLTYPRNRVELLVVGGEHDPGRAVVEAFTGLIQFPTTYCVVPERELRSASFKRNEGGRAAHGTIIAFTDDDCVAQQDWIAEGVTPFQISDVGGVEGAVEIPRDAKPTPTYRGSLRLSITGGYQTCNMFYRKAVFEECGGFDLRFPYYLEDTDFAYTVIERGYSIPFAPGAVVAHPVQVGRPLKLLTMARTTEHIPYLFRKHPQSRSKLRGAIKVLNRSHRAYMALYAVGLLLGLVKPLAGVVAVGVGLGILLPVHLAHDFWGLHFTVSELVLTGLCQPIVPVLRSWYWLKGLVQVRSRTRANS